MKKINWWSTYFGNKEINKITKSINNKNISLGPVTQDFENKLSEYLNIKHVIAVSSGSTALLLSLISINIQKGDEVIIPNRSWIALAHAIHMLGAKAVLVDVEKNRPIIDANKIEEKITSKTKAIIPVHLNGRSANMIKILKLAKKFNIYVIEDAAQAIASKNKNGFLGTQGHLGCFSLSVAKTIATGQGGFITTNNDFLADKIRLIRTHGVENVNDVENWKTFGFNFRFTDILSSIGIEQLKRLPNRIKKLNEIYLEYYNLLNKKGINFIPVNLNNGELPVYAEILVDNRDQFIKQLSQTNIETRSFYPNIDKAKYMIKNKIKFLNSEKYEKNGVYLPCGPNQKISDIRKVISIINNL